MRFAVAQNCSNLVDLQVATMPFGTESHAFTTPRLKTIAMSDLQAKSQRQTTVCLPL
jgi:hypothetical protein